MRLQRLEILLTRYIREQYKLISDTEKSIEVQVSFDEVFDYVNANRIWQYDSISFNGEQYKFKDIRFGHDGFCKLIRNVLGMSKAHGEVVTCKFIEDGVNHEVFDKLILYPKPCKEFKFLQHIIQKYSKFDICEFDIFSVAIQGKTFNWNEKGHKEFLHVDVGKCQRAIDFIRGCRLKDDAVEAEIIEDIDFDCDNDTDTIGENGKIRKLLSIKIVKPDSSIRGMLKIC